MMVVMKMKKITNELKKIIKEIEGKVLLIGDYSTDINQIISDNKNVIFCEQLTRLNNKIVSNQKSGKTKKINIKKIKKKYKKNGINYLFIEEEQIIDFKNTFIRDSVYVAKNKIYFIKSKESEQIVKMYSRHSKKIDIIPCLDGKIICIDVTGCKNNKLKDIWFYMIDCFTDVINIISDILIN